MRDEFGYPGLENYDADQMLEMQAFVSAAFKAFDYSWNHPRLLEFLKKVEAVTQRPCKTPHQLPFKYYRLLAMSLAADLVALLEKEQQRRTAIANSEAFAVAIQMLRTSHKQLTEAKR